MRKLIFRLTSVLVVILVLAAGVLWFGLDHLAKRNIEKGATEATGVQTTASGVNLMPFGGELHVRDIHAANVEGFEAPHLLRTDHFAAHFRPRSLLTNTIHITVVEIEGLDIHVEQHLGRDNISMVMANIQAYQAARRAGESDDVGRRMQIDRLVIRDLKAHVQLLPVGGGVSRVTVPIPEMVFDDLTADEAGGVVIAEVVSRVLPAIVAAILQEGGHALPEPLRESMADAVGGLAELIDAAVLRNLGGLLEGAGGVLNGIFGGNRDR